MYKMKYYYHQSVLFKIFNTFKEATEFGLTLGVYDVIEILLKEDE